jgi:hypothetical protein
MSVADELEREALRLNRRYVVEVVEQYSLCPWAERARRDGRVTERVFLQEISELQARSLETIQELSALEEIEIALFIYPLANLGRLDFEHFARLLRAEDQAQHEVGEVPFAIAAFHPDAPPVLSSAERLIPFLRRTPDPTLQLVRTSTLERTRGVDEGTSFLDVELVSPFALKAPPRPTVRERVAEANLATVERCGTNELERVFEDIKRDRDETYARLLGAA